MVSFVRGQPIKTATPTITVDAGLAAGVHRFQLVVHTDTGQASVPAVVDVEVVRILVDPLRPVIDTRLVSPLPSSPTLTTTTATTIAPVATTSATTTSATTPTAIGSVDTTLVRPRSAPTRKPRKPRKES